MARKLVDFKNFSVYWDTEMLGSVEETGGLVVREHVVVWRQWPCGVVWRRLED